MMLSGGFLKHQITLAHVSGIPVRAGYSWLAVLVLMAAITAVNVDSLVRDPAWSIALGVAASLAFFASIFLHEFAHAVVARFEGLKVVEIVLHPFGGLARFRHPPETPRAEFRIAVAGPVASFLLAFLFGGLAAVSQYARTDILTLLLTLLALTNFLLAVFNMLPGYPLDGGRVLRAYLWKQGRDLNEATTLTGRCGQMIAVGLIVLGIIYVILRGEFFTGFWAVLVGIFLFDSASTIIRETASEDMIAVESVMSLPAPISPNSTIQHLVDDILPMFRRTTFAVVEDGRFVGILKLDDAKAVDVDFWRVTFVREVMRPFAEGLFVYKGTSLADARYAMSRTKAGAVAVLDDTGTLVGLVQLARLNKRK
ncbi:MAG TPA: site-2 protease family protein [Pyrinomonadaceae bacterium]|nr:site-2 protease family protein [Pyrinomonadaceae bacterium]